MSARWTRTPYGYLSADGRWYLERGGRMTHGCNAWLIWQRDEDQGPTDREDRYVPRRRFDELAGVDDQTWFVDTGVEGGWLSEAKDIVARWEETR